MWFDGYGEFEGKILELSLNEKEQIDKEDASGFDLYMLEGLVMNEPKRNDLIRRTILQSISQTFCQVRRLLEAAFLFCTNFQHEWD